MLRWISQFGVLPVLSVAFVAGFAANLGFLTLTNCAPTQGETVIESIEDETVPVSHYRIIQTPSGFSGREQMSRMLCVTGSSDDAGVKDRFRWFHSHESDSYDTDDACPGFVKPTWRCGCDAGDDK